MNYYIKLFYEIEKRNMLNIVIDILCLSLGLLIGMVFLSQAHSAYDDFYLNQKYMPLRQYVVCKPAVESMRILKNELDEVKAENQNILDIQVFNRLNDEVVWSKTSFCPAISVIAVTEGYFNLFEGDYLVGENVEDGQSAVIGKSAAKKYNIRIGDEIEIKNRSFVVKGILNIPQYKDCVLVLTDILQEKEFYDCQYYIKLLSNDKGVITDFFEKKYGVYEVYTHEENREAQKDRLQSGWSFSIAIAVITLCYGLINIYNIEQFFILKQKKVIAILRALGASKGKLVCTKIFRSVLIAWASVSVSAILVLILENTFLGELINFHMTFPVYAVAFILLAVIYMVFSFLLCWRYYNKDISKIVAEI